MSDILNKTIVLVLNRNWQAINIRTDGLEGSDAPDDVLASSGVSFP